ncbi:hypothetical protein NE237_003755 [Protea cynaroides]|uniref:Uncharacterized protein n=1 Tax=Protea cynaroides TaxID=273540 RepID=A0A9Q0KI11_9MAGN|nr:hypothetical protein NE237_003755 [Protea cynaroides]
MLIVSLAKILALEVTMLLHTGPLEERTPAISTISMLEYLYVQNNSVYQVNDEWDPDTGDGILIPVGQLFYYENAHLYTTCLTTLMIIDSTDSYYTGLLRHSSLSPVIERFP